MLHREGANFLLELFLGSGNPANFYVAALRSETAYGDTGTDLDEPTVGAYARVQVPNDGTHFLAAVDGTVYNAAAITFPTATASWGTIRHWALTDAATGGALFLSGRITSRSVREGRTLYFPIQNLTVKAR